MDLDERKSAILRAIVEEHVSTAQPVGSQTVARSPGMNVSSATVRNEMTVLERDGYIVAPHTSAGRIPTDLGYRYFVDHFTRQGALPGPQKRAVVRLLHALHVGQPGARRSPARDEPTARAGELAHRGRRRSALASRGRHGPQRAAGASPAVARARARDPVERQRREVRAASRRRSRRRNGGGRRACARCATH